MGKPIVYIIGSLRDERIVALGKRLREEAGVEVFDDWHAAGPIADDSWQKYETLRGRSYKEALRGYAAEHVFEFDHTHLRRATHVVLMLPCGKSGHIELGYAVGQGKRAYVLFDKEPERWDQMYQFVFETEGDVFFNEEDLVKELKHEAYMVD